MDAPLPRERQVRPAPLAHVAGTCWKIEEPFAGKQGTHRSGRPPGLHPDLLGTPALLATLVHAFLSVMTITQPGRDLPRPGQARTDSRRCKAFIARPRDLFSEQEG